MKKNDAPEIVDFDRYKAAQAAAKAKEKAQQDAQAKAEARARKAASGQSFLGSRPKAGLILVLIAVALVALLVLPRVLG